MNPSGNLLSRLLAVVVAPVLLLLVGTQTAFAATYTVTSGALCGGAGTFEQAIKSANANPGKDTVAFTPGLTVDVSVCAALYPGVEQFPIVATESVDIVGNGAKIVGNQYWFDQTGQMNNTLLCPDAIGTNAYWMSFSKGFLAVGTYGQDNSSIKVSALGLSFDNLPELVAAYDKSSFTLTNSTATNINSFNGNCSRGAIAGFPGANVTLRSVQIDHSYAPGMHTGDINFEGLISGNDGALVMERVFLGENGQGRAVAWGNYQGTSTVMIVSSKIVESGGLRLDATNTDIVNTAFFTHRATSADRVMAFMGVTTVRASTFFWTQPACDSSCAIPGMGFWAPGTGTIALASTAIGAWATYPNSGPLLFGDVAKFSSDARTWVQQTVNQNNAELVAILPNVMTSVPGLTPIGVGEWWVDVVTPLLGDAVNPGVLIDVIDCTADPLLNPIDNLPIATDVLGNPRCDSNGKRNIGAVQVALSPYLTVAAVASRSVSLAWNRPKDPPSGGITGYGLCYGTGSLPDNALPACPGTPVNIAGPDNLTRDVTALVNGTTYWFMVRGVNGIGPGPWSNVVTATPLGPVGLPQVSAVVGEGQVQLFWTRPDFGGRPGPYTYDVLFRIVGQPDWILGPQGVSGQTATITGLRPGVTYEFGVIAHAGDGGVSPTVSPITAALPMVVPMLSYHGLLILASLLVVLTGWHLRQGKCR